MAATAGIQSTRRPRPRWRRDAPIAHSRARVVRFAPLAAGNGLDGRAKASVSTRLRFAGPRDSAIAPLSPPPCVPSAAAFIVAGKRVCRLWSRIAPGMRGYARVCASMRGYARACAGMRDYARVCASMHEHARVCAGMRRHVRVWTCMREYCISTSEYVRVCTSTIVTSFVDCYMHCSATPAYSSILEHTRAYSNIREHTRTHPSMLERTRAYSNALERTRAYSECSRPSRPQWLLSQAGPHSGRGLTIPPRPLLSPYPPSTSGCSC